MLNHRERSPRQSKASHHGRRKLLIRAGELTLDGIVADTMLRVQPIKVVARRIAYLRERGRTLDSQESILRRDNSKFQEIERDQTTSSALKTHPLLTRSIQLNGSHEQYEDILPPNAEKWLEQNWRAVLAAGASVASIAGTITGYMLRRRGPEEQRFHDILTGFDSHRIEGRIFAAQRLLTFLHEPRHEKYYEDIFRLCVINLRNREVTKVNPSPDTFYQELIKLFKEVTPLLGRKLNLGALSGEKLRRMQEKHFNANGVRLDSADLQGAQLQRLSLKNANFTNANLSQANLSHSILTGANPEIASSLQNTIMHNVSGSSRSFQYCLEKGALFDQQTIDRYNLDTWDPNEP